MSQGDENRGLKRTVYQLRTAGMTDKQSSNLRSGIHNRGYLPHIKIENARYFVTFRLADSLPKAVLLEFEQAHAAALRQLKSDAGKASVDEINRDLRRKIERYLDQGVGACWLAKPEIAALNIDAWMHFHNIRYRLDSWVVMPNHMHLILWPMPNHTLSEILKSRKRQTARQSNLLLNRTGEVFWQPESYDHWIRSDKEMSRIRQYIHMNPVKAGLCKKPEDWKWSSATGCSPVSTSAD